MDNNEVEALRRRKYEELADILKSINMAMYVYFETMTTDEVKALEASSPFKLIEELVSMEKLYRTGTEEEINTILKNQGMPDTLIKNVLKARREDLLDKGVGSNTAVEPSPTTVVMPETKILQ